MLIRKITNGYVVQVFDTNHKKFIAQEFIAGDECECEYEDAVGTPCSPSELEVNDKELYLPYDMVQPATWYNQPGENK